MSVTGHASPLDVVRRFHAAEDAFMNAGGAGEGASFSGIAATLDPDVVLHQSPDLPWGGTFRGHAGYENWARQMSRAFDTLAVKDACSFADGDTVVITCRLVTRSRVTGETLDLPMVQVVRVRGDRIIAFQPFYWNVPAYRDAVRSAT